MTWNENSSICLIVHEHGYIKQSLIFLFTGGIMTNCIFFEGWNAIYQKKQKKENVIRWWANEKRNLVPSSIQRSPLLLSHSMQTLLHSANNIQFPKNGNLQIPIPSHFSLGILSFPLLFLARFNTTIKKIIPIPFPHKKKEKRKRAINPLWLVIIAIFPVNVA